MPSLVDTLKSTVFHRRRLPLPSCTLRGLQAWRRKCCTSTAVPTAPSPASKSGLMALSSAFFIIKIIAGVASTCGNMASLNRSARCSGYTRNVWRPNVLVAAGKAANLVGERPTPSIARFPYGDHKRNGRVKPPQTEQRVRDKPDQHRSSQNGAQEVLCPFAISGTRPDLFADALFGAPEPWTKH